MRFAQRHRDAWPAVAIIVATVAAYHFTLTSLFDFLRLDTPLAYLPLLPLFCIGIAMITARRFEQAKRPIQDRQIDFLVGIPMVVLALLLITLAPVIASAYYWSDRADVVSLALFAAGATPVAPACRRCDEELPTRRKSDCLCVADGGEVVRAR